MHSSSTSAGRVYHYNPDFSGEVVLVMEEHEVVNEDLRERRSVLVAVPTWDLHEIVAHAGDKQNALVEEEAPVARELPVGSILAEANAVCIKRYDRYDEEEYWMPAEAYPLGLTNRQMQERINNGSYRLLRYGPESPVQP